MSAVLRSHCWRPRGGWRGGMSMDAFGNRNRYSPSLHRQSRHGSEMIVELPGGTGRVLPPTIKRASAASTLASTPLDVRRSVITGTRGAESGMTTGKGAGATAAKWPAAQPPMAAVATRQPQSMTSRGDMLRVEVSNRCRCRDSPSRRPESRGRSGLVHLRDMWGRPSPCRAPS